ncbi:FixH family protein [Sulfurimonas microaerophilic]|uniref:FixH family protein n=1 Tax=Sulfurimonas microaerophilic TaxID=3058392 RepID=UPI0027147B3F|nr:FixH family protein [Sulfurimonas sp. hsl 1-7]
MAKLSSGKIWPYILGGSITLVFGMCVATIMVTSKADIQESNAYMSKYQEADARANEFINAQINFDKKYNIEYVTESIGVDKPQIKYKVTDKSGKLIDNAEIIIDISRPETEKFNQLLETFTVQEGIYTFEGATFPKVGVWNIIARVQVGDDYRFYNLKADTRIKEVFEF